MVVFKEHEIENNKEPLFFIGYTIDEIKMMESILSNVPLGSTNFPLASKFSNFLQESEALRNALKH